MLKKGKSINPISHSRTAKFLHYTMFFNGLDILFVALLLCPSRLYGEHWNYIFFSQKWKLVVYNITVLTVRAI